MTLTVVGPEVPSTVHQLVERALADLVAHRGGAALLREAHRLVGSSDTESLLRTLAHRGSLFALEESGEFVAVALAYGDEQLTLLGIYVATSHRRAGRARSMLAAISASNHVITDTWALPGDRAMKRLYEEAGFKTRRLTMSRD